MQVSHWATTPVSVIQTLFVRCVPTLLPAYSVSKATISVGPTARPVLYPSVVTATRMASVTAVCKASYWAVVTLVFVLKASRWATTPVSVRTTRLVSYVPTLLLVDSVRQATISAEPTARPVRFLYVVNANRMASAKAVCKASHWAVAILVSVLKAFY